jgi:hypothetical protein
MCKDFRPSRENQVLAIHTDQPAKPEQVRRAGMRIKHHKIAVAAPIRIVEIQG